MESRFISLLVFVSFFSCGSVCASGGSSTNVADLEYRLKRIEEKLNLASDSVSYADSSSTEKSSIELLDRKFANLSEKMKAIERSSNEILNEHKAQSLENSQILKLYLDKTNSRIDEIATKSIAYLKMSKQNGEDISDEEYKKLIDDIKSARSSVSEDEIYDLSLSKDDSSNFSLDEIPDTEVSEMDRLYSESYNKFLKKDYKASALGFREFTNRYPDSSLAANASFWIAESLQLDNDDSATDAFDYVYDRYPESNKASLALIKAADLYKEKGENEKATMRYLTVTRSYKNSSESATARERLAKMGIIIPNEYQPLLSPQDIKEKDSSVIKQSEASNSDEDLSPSDKAQDLELDKSSSKISNDLLLDKLLEIENRNDK